MAETLAVVEILLVKCLVAVLTLASQEMTMLLPLVVFKAVMVSSSETTTIKAAV